MTKWKRKNGEVIVADGKMPPDVVCDCGSNSSSKNIQMADRIVCLPDMLTFLSKIFSDVEVREVMNRVEATMRINVTVIDEFVSLLMQHGVVIPITYRKLVRERQNKGKAEDSAA